MRGARTNVSGLGVAFATLFLMMAAHASLESARDALLLQALTPSALLWTYVVIAVVAIGMAKLPRWRRLVSLSGVLVAGGTIALGFWLALPALGPPGTVAFYVFTAIYATIIVPRFWLLLANRFTVSDAKQYYAWIGLGGIAGAAVGSGTSAFLLSHVPVRDLLVAGGALYAAAAVVALRLGAGPAPTRAAKSTAAQETGSQAYLKLIVSASLLASATLTVVDYLFKSVAAATLPPAELAQYFAWTYTAMNVLAFVAQVLVAPTLLRLLGTHSAAVLLPVSLLVASGGFALTGWPALSLAAKSADGALRSLHRVTSELFYFPLSDDVRRRWKPQGDAFAQRGGQALASLLLLALIGLGGGPRLVACAAVVLAVGWLVRARRMRAPYAALFRESLRRGGPAGEIEPLASETLQAVLEAFSSTDERMVTAAIDFLGHHGQARLVPAVLVHHPSPRVALRALEVLASARGPQVIDLTRPLLQHPDATMRAAALRLRMQQSRDVAEALAALDDPSDEVRTTAMVVLVSTATHRPDATARIEAIVAGDAEAPRLALARAIRDDPRPELRPHLLTMLDATALAVRREALRALVRVPDRAVLVRLLPLLAERRILTDVRAAILACSFGDSSTVEGWLLDESLPRPVRRHVPRTLSAFATSGAAAILTARLEHERDGAVLYKILRGLGRMRADDPDLPVDAEALRRYARTALASATRMLAYRVALAEAPRTDPVERFLVALLREKEDHALERVFRALGVIHPEMALEEVWRGIHATDSASRAAALEIVETVQPELRLRMTAILDGQRPDRERLRWVGGRPLTRAAALEAMRADESSALRELAGRLDG